ncbi:MAG: hypothetical protein V4677_06005 [Bacteroidota bacterium]
MNHTSYSPEYCVYRNKTTNAYVLVAQQFAKIIRQYVTEYQSLASVPANIKVKGILTDEPISENLNPLNSHMTDVEINQLSF